MDALREAARDRRVGLRDQRLGEQAERAHRGLQLVADVGDEVAADLLQPSSLGHVVDDGDHPERALPSSMIWVRTLRVRRGGP